jgi:hypothetical protein
MIPYGKLIVFGYSFFMTFIYLVIIAVYSYRIIITLLTICGGISVTAIYIQLTLVFPRVLGDSVKHPRYKCKHLILKITVVWDIAPCSFIEIDDGGSTHL